MTLIKSISGIRGTIGGVPGDSLTPPDVVKFSSAFGMWVKTHAIQHKVVVGRDARPSGEMISHLVCSTLNFLGIDVIDLGLCTTPTVAMAVPFHQAGGGIIITASHNPIEWNALKLLGSAGEFISASDGELIISNADQPISYVSANKTGSYTRDNDALDRHIDAILKLPTVDGSSIKSQNFRIAVDAVNSIGGSAIPLLLNRLGVSRIKEINCDITGNFAHNPEPLHENLNEIRDVMGAGQYDLGIAVDPDVDRLAFICEDGTSFGEEYTVVAVSDYVLNGKTGNTVSNLSSSRALKDITEKHGGVYFASAVGEVNVVAKMKQTGAIIGGEGNGGVIYPSLHYGRDSLVGTALFLTHLAKSKKTVSEIRKSYPEYYISKNKIQLSEAIDVDEILNEVEKRYQREEINTVDGLKIDFEHEWVHLRKSNTEPIIRIYAEAANISKAEKLASDFLNIIENIAGIQS